MDHMEILRLENLSFTYPMCEAPAVCDLSLSIPEGELVVICGATGSGKSTLLRLLKREIAPLGKLSGKILYRHTAQEALSAEESACKIGFVMQNPEHQIVTDKVWHELAFGLENQNLPRDVIARRIAEMASYFGIEHWYDRSVSELSGGQKQLLSLASVMVMNPDILILDEPTAQLDPIAASDFIATLHKLNRDFSLTILIAEHRLEALIPICHRLLVMEDGKLLANGAPEQVISAIGDREDLLLAMPAAARLYHALHQSGECPLTVGEGRAMIQSTYDNSIRAIGREDVPSHGDAVMEFSGVCFRYGKTLPDVLSHLTFTVYEKEIFCILGGNGSGKTTALSAAAGFLRPYKGTIRIFGKRLWDYSGQSLYRNCLTLLPQDVGTVFLKNTVAEELADVGAQVEAFPFDLKPLLSKHPYDLSGGEQQLVALAKVLATHPCLLLMDEPTKGLDAKKKQELIAILRTLKESGVTVVVVTHDVEFTALCADRCAFFFRGEIVSQGVPDEFFSENTFYTTASARMTKGYFDRAVTVETVAELCLRNGKKQGEESVCS